MRKGNALRRKAPRPPRSKLAFYRDDLESLQTLLRRIAESHSLDGCLVYSVRHEVLIAEHGIVSPERREELIGQKRAGISLGWSLRLVGLAAEEIRPLESAAAEEVRSFLKQIAARKDAGKRITMEFGRPFPPRRA